MLSIHFPGCLSCTKVSDPIFGPNFTHLNLEKDLVLFLGSVDVSSSKDRYLKCLSELNQKCCGELQKFPWIINTMGFNTGLGADLMKKSTDIFKPTTIVEIESRLDKQS
jgi:polynucleotide 5'-hydroxyl-kinase GRC3/NOL9